MFVKLAVAPFAESSHSSRAAEPLVLAELEIKGQAGPLVAVAADIVQIVPPGTPNHLYEHPVFAPFIVPPGPWWLTPVSCGEYEARRRVEQ